MSPKPEPSIVSMMDNPAETMRDVMADIGHHEEIDTPVDLDLTKAHLITTPNHREVKDLTSMHREALEYLKPARRKGTAKLDDLQSLIDWTNRFKGPTSVLFADPNTSDPSIMCVADYHAGGPADQENPTGEATARHCHHRATYNFPLSEEWKAWMEISGVPLEKDDLGEFIETNAKDIMDPTAAILENEEASGNENWENRLIRTAQQIEGRYGQLTQLLKMSKQFQVYETSDLTIVSNRDTGEGAIQFLNEHKDASGQPLKIPNLIIIAIPVFLNGAPYRMPVRFRYRKTGASIKFILTVYNPEKSFESAFDEAVTEATEATELLTLMGSPEA
jgi:Uncharacterized conserved protein (DUF2303)